jgi:hypothetical protein
VTWPLARAGDTGNPNRFLAKTIGGNDAERWPSAGKVRLPAAKHEGAEVEAILVDKIELGEARREDRPATSISPSTSFFSVRTNASTFSPTSVAFAPTDFSVRDTTHFGCARHVAANS